MITFPNFDGGGHLLPIHHRDCMPAANHPQHASFKHAESASRRRGRLAKPTHPHREGRGAPWGTGYQIRPYKTTRSGDQFVMSLFVCALHRSALPSYFLSFNHFDGFYDFYGFYGFYGFCDHKSTTTKVINFMDFMDFMRF